jgi:hypothetical protein
MSKDTAQQGKVTFQETDLPVGELEIDPEIQRSFLKETKVQAYVKNWNDRACGRILVSRRVDRSIRVLDGWHRLEAKRRLTDNLGTIPVEMYTGLTKQEEAELFLDRNAGDKPTTIDRYRVSLVAGDFETTEIDKIVHAFGWKVTQNTGTHGLDGNLGCVVALRNLYRYSTRWGFEPNLLDMALRTIRRSWGNDAAAGQGHIITGIGRVIGEYGDRLNLDSFIERLRVYKGGPLGLSTTARQYASMKRMRLPMAVAELLVEEYNKGRGDKTRLSKWSKRA